MYAMLYISSCCYTSNTLASTCCACQRTRCALTVICSEGVSAPLCEHKTLHMPKVCLDDHLAVSCSSSLPAGSLTLPA